MRKTCVLMLFFAAATFLVASCDTGSSATVLDGQASALVGDEEDAAAEEAESVENHALAATDNAADESDVADDQNIHDGDEAAPSPLRVEWTDDAEMGPRTSLSFSITNTMAATLSFSVSIAAESAIGSAVRPIGEVTLGSGESKSYTVQAKDLPVRSTVAISSVSVRITRSVVGATSVMDVVEDLATRFVKHEAGYGRARAFNEEMLRAEHGGVLVSARPKGSVATAGAEEVGEVWRGKAFAKRTRKDSDLLVRDESGNVCGVVTQMAIGSMPQSEVPDAPAAPDTGDATETEVDHE